jgi:hypothetical protein
MKPITHRPVRMDQTSREQLRQALGKGHDLGAGARLLRDRIVRQRAALRRACPRSFRASRRRRIDRRSRRRCPEASSA